MASWLRRLSTEPDSSSGGVYCNNAKAGSSRPRRFKIKSSAASRKPSDDAELDDRRLSLPGFSQISEFFHLHSAASSRDTSPNHRSLPDIWQEVNAAAHNKTYIHIQIIMLWDEFWNIFVYNSVSSDDNHLCSEAVFGRSQLSRTRHSRCHETSDGDGEARPGKGALYGKKQRQAPVDRQEHGKWKWRS